MIRHFVRSVVHNATVTSADAAPPVSIRIDALILRAADLLPMEEVEVVDVVTGERFVTWVEAAVEGSGIVRVHAGDARHVRAGDVISIVSHGLLHDGQTLNHRAKRVTLDEKNRVISLTEG